MSYTQTYGSGWTLTLEPLADMVVARLVRGDEAYELIAKDHTLLELQAMGYQPAVRNSETGEPWVIWEPADQSSLYVWVCPAGVAAWTNDISLSGGPN